MKKVLKFKPVAVVLIAIVILLSGVLVPNIFGTNSVLSPLTVSAAYYTGTYKVNDSLGVNVRSGAGTKYSIVGAASNGVTFNVTKTSGSYGYTSSIKCTNGTRSGWVHLGYCTYVGSTSSSGSNTTASYNGSIGKLDLNAAYEYAKNNWSNGNKSNDCCRYVYNILSNGGISFDQSYAYVPDLIEYLRSKKVQYYNKYSTLSSDYKDGSNFSINDIHEGDCVTIDGYYGRDHIVYVVAVDYTNSRVYITGHSNDAFYDKDTGKTNNNCVYSFDSIAGVLQTSALASTSNNVIKGDVNNSGGKPTITDLVRLQMYLNDPNSVSINLDAADCNSDGRIDNDDYEALRLYITNIISDMTGYHANSSNTQKNVTIKSALSTRTVTYVFDVYGGNSDNETAVTLYKSHGGSNQLFDIIPVDNEWYVIKPSYTDKVFDLYSGTDSSKTNQLQIYSQHSSDNQLFKFIQNSDGSVYILSKSGYYLTTDIYGRLYGSSLSAKTTYQKFYLV